MKKRKQILLKIWPYALCVLAGLIFFLTSIQLTDNFKGLILNIAAAFFAIPFLYLISLLSQRLIFKSV